MIFIVHTINWRCLAHFTICIGKCQCPRPQRLLDLCWHRKKYPSDVSVFSYWAVISTITVSLGHQKEIYELIDWLLTGLRVIRHRKMPVLVHLHVLIKSSIGECVLCFTKSMSNSDVIKCLSVEVNPTSDWNRCVISCLYSCVFYLVVWNGTLITRTLFTVVHPGKMEAD